uniref:Uncharacterized protein n=1 Tax=Pseudodiaptomus poplesia TaxID=213370 RepID=A0A0U2UG03_9MAXI|nr:hypothetical protein [Pseudodiaptomus poplesia]
MEAVLCFLVLTLVQIGSCNPYGPPYAMQKNMMPYYGGMHPESFPVEGRSADSGAACVTEICSVTLHVVDRDGECVKDAMVYYTSTSIGVGLCRTDKDGYVTFNVRGCETLITVHKEGMEVASKTIDLSQERQSSCFIEMKPICNYWLLVMNTENSPRVHEHAKVVYGYKGLVGVATTDSSGYACIHVEDGESVRAIASTFETLVGVFEQKVDLSLSNEALINVPYYCQDLELLKVTLAWSNTINLDLYVVQFNSRKDDLCVGSACTSVTKYGASTTDGKAGGEMLVWTKPINKNLNLNLIFVTSTDALFYDSQARVVLYNCDGKTKLITADKKRSSSAGYWLVGCLKDGDFSTFKKINEITTNVPDENTCSLYL